METGQIKYQEVLKLVQSLPTNQIMKLRSAIDRRFLKKEYTKKSDFQEFLLSAPVMTEKEYKSFLENRKHFNHLMKTGY